MPDKPTHFSVKNYDIFHNLNSNQQKILQSLARPIKFEAEEIIAEEGKKAEVFYCIMKGRVNVLKSSEQDKKLHLATLHQNDVVGELALLQTNPRTATLVAATHVELYSFHLKDIQKYPKLYAALITNLSKKLGERLKYSNTLTVQSMEKALREEKKRETLALFVQVTLTALATFTLSVSLIKSLHVYFLNPTISSTILFYLYAFFIFYYLKIYLKKSGLSKKDFGLTLKNWKVSIVESVLWSIPIIALIIFLKWIVISTIPAFKDDKLFSFASAFAHNSEINWYIYFFSFLAYLSTCPIQEFIIRGIIQGSLELLLSGSHLRRVINSIFVSNLLFAAFHTHRSTFFAFSIFFVGLFWGWLYSRHKTIIGVSISHCLIGGFAGFILGINELFVF